ncbi:Nickel and cobalt resistance protein CnrB [Paraburkholderia ultramafica]|uniref:Nickel and cobalt resistance protein CnrB n=2 Tax=Paraburkholderia ultramafica TaxID=1544867 RepID=A0A6S7B5I2_9BURK|nr:Nickel and cobalt resistance protein CnrB [Paraburkholderia ultramafica]
MWETLRADKLTLSASIAIACLCLTLPSYAAEQTAEFAVSPSQMQGLGITVLKLSDPGVVPAIAAPARAVLSPNRDMVVSAPLDGVVDRLLVNPHDVVKAGQPLMQLASPAYSDLQLRLMDASSKARLARQTLDREAKLFAEGIIPERRVQEAQAGDSAASAALRQIEAELRLAGADPSGARRSAAAGKIDAVLIVRARSNGLVVSLDAKPGQRVRQADLLARIADLSEMWLEIQVPTNTDVARGTALTVTGKDVRAVAESTGRMVSDSQTTTLRARVTAGADKLLPGEVLQVNIPAPTPEGWTLPLPSVTRQDDRAYVFVRSSKGFVATPINVLSSAGQSVRVQGNLKRGQEVAVSSVIALKAAWLGKGGGE